MNQHPHLLRDRRGTSSIQMLILAVGLALAGMAAVKVLVSGVGGRSECAGEQIKALGGGPAPCVSPTTTSPATPTQAAPADAEEGGEGGEDDPEEFDAGKELLDLLADLVGFTDAKKCVTEGDILACVLTIANFTPGKIFGLGFKVFKNANKIKRLVDRLLAAKRAKKAKEAEEAAQRCASGKCDRPGVCFAPGTLVHAETGLVPIESLRPGDQVFSRDDETGEEGYRSVVRTFVTPEQPLLELVLYTGDDRVESLEVTAPHPFWVEGRGWVAAGQLQPDDVVSAAGGELRVAGVVPTGQTTTVYNVEVEEFHTYFVGESAAWVHNDCGDLTPEQIAGKRKELAEVEEQLKNPNLTGKQKKALREQKKKLKEELGDDAGDAAGAGEKAVNDKLGELADVRDQRAADIIRSRGGNASNVREALGDKFRDATVEDIARAAANGDRAAEKALKIIKQAAQKGQDH